MVSIKKIFLGWHLLPFLGFFLIVLVVFVLLLDDERQNGIDLPDIMVGRAAPVVELPLLDANNREETILLDGSLWLSNKNNSKKTQLGQARKIKTSCLSDQKVTLVNFWASWCAPCRVEHPFLMQLAKDCRLNVVGVNYKDSYGNAKQFLRKLGNPYQVVGRDERGRAAIEWGVYGAPETYLVDRKGIIIYRHIGPLSATVIENKIFNFLERNLP